MLYFKRILTLVSLAIIIAGCSEKEEEKVSENVMLLFSMKNINNPLFEDITFKINEEEKTITGYLSRWIYSETPDRLVASFTTSTGANVYVNNTLQESGVTVNSFKDEIIYTVKHPENGAPTEYKVRLICAQISAALPIMRFYISKNSLPRKDANYAKTKLEITPNGVAGSIWTYDDSEIEIRLRGNSTQDLPKKPLRIKFPEKIKPLGTGEAIERNWVLLANDADKTLLRNALAFSISQTLLKKGDTFHNPKAVLFTPATQFVDVYLSDYYQGVYDLTDHIQRNPGRVDLQSPGADDLSGGYLFELDGFASGGYTPTGFSEGEFAWFRTPKGMTATLKYPDMEDDYTDKADVWSDPRFKYIEQHVALAEKTLFAENYTDKDEGWRKYFDESTLIDYYIISEFTGNPDAWWSTFMYKLRDSDSQKLFFGPVWDFDIAFDNDARLGYAGEKLMLEYAHEPRTWIIRFMSDTELKKAIKERWNSKKDELLRSALQSLETNEKIIHRSRIANFMEWNITIQNLRHGKAAPANYEAGYEQLKTYIERRHSYLDLMFNKW